jgi:Spy/CpxP family protein refolding chaperone
MLRRVRFNLQIAVALAVFATMPAKGMFAQTPSVSYPDRKVLSDFSKQAKDYVGKEHALAADKMKPTSDVSKLEQQRKQLRDAVQQSRPNAKRGDFFTPEAEKAFRKLLGDVLNGPDGAKIKASLNHAEPGASAAFRVNAEFPNQNGQPIQSVPPTVLKVLPVLPKEMEYCIAGSTLALRDSSTNMVVDFLPNALP